MSVHHGHLHPSVPTAGHACPWVKGLRPPSAAHGAMPARFARARDVEAIAVLSAGATPAPRGWGLLRASRHAGRFSQKIPGFGCCPTLPPWVCVFFELWVKGGLVPSPQNKIEFAIAQLLKLIPSTHMRPYYTDVPSPPRCSSPCIAMSKVRSECDACGVGNPQCKPTFRVYFPPAA